MISWAFGECLRAVWRTLEASWTGLRTSEALEVLITGVGVGEADGDGVIGSSMGAVGVGVEVGVVWRFIVWVISDSCWFSTLVCWYRKEEIAIPATMTIATAKRKIGLRVEDFFSGRVAGTN